MKTAALLVRCLENEGVEYIFGLPGEQNVEVMDALRSSSIRFVLTRHEQGAGFMADVYGRLTGKAGVCLATLGPGATNLITPVADANMDRAPLVALTAQVGQDRLHKESHQHLDVVSLFRPVTKWNTSLTLPGIVPEAVRKAFKLAQAEKPGATHLEIPEDVAEQEAEAGPLRVQEPHPGPAAPAQLERARRIIAEARRPIILAGNGVVRARACAELVRFAERWNIPVATTFMAKGAIPDSHPLAQGAIGLHYQDHVNGCFARADVVVAVGYDLVEYDPAEWNPRGDKAIVHVDRSPAEVDAAYIVGVGVMGDIAASLNELSEGRVPARSAAPDLDSREQLRAELDRHRHDLAFPLKPQRILADLRAALREDDIVISDVGAHKFWLARLYPCYRPNTCIISNGFASMGIAVPGAVAAKLACPNRRVVAVTGDGGFLMNSQELETARRLGTSLVVLIFRDNTYGLIKWKLLDHAKEPAFTDFTNPDLVRYAESFGARGYRIEAAEQLLPALQSALAWEGVAVVDCPVDFSENLRLTGARGRGESQVASRDP